MNRKQCLLILSKKQYASFTISGKSFKYNQLVNNGNFVDSSNWENFGGTLSVSNNEGTLTITSSASSNRLQCNATIQSGHKYILSFYANCDSTTHMFLLVNSVSIANDILITQNTNEQHSIIFTATESGTLPIRFYCNMNGTYLQIGDEFKMSKVMIIDLTQLYGTGNEPASVNDFNATDLGQVINNGFYLPTTADNVIYNAETPFNFVYKTFAPTTDFELRGINNAQDIYRNTTGIITRKIGVVDLGTLSWNYNNGLFWTKISDRKSGNMNINIAKYKVVNSYSNMPDNSITGGYLYYADNIIINDTNYNNASDFKIAMDGVYLYYELQTSTTENVQSVMLKKSTNKCYDKNGLELTII